MILSTLLAAALLQLPAATPDAATPAPEAAPAAAATVDAGAPAPAAPVASTDPQRAAVEAAWAKGRDFFVERHVKPALAQALSGGYLKLKDRKGREKTLGPEVYVEYQLYDLILFLVHHRDFGFGADDPLVRQSFEWLLSKQDPKKGNWPRWSAEGCLHTKGTLVLQRFGKTEEAKKALAWNLASPLYARPGFIEGESGFLIQSWGSPSGSLTGTDFFIYGKQTAEMTLLNLFTFHELGYTAQDPLAKANLEWVYRWLRKGTWRNDEFDAFAGLAKIPELVERYQLDPKLARTTVENLAAKLAKPARRKTRLEKDIYFIGDVLRGLLDAQRIGHKLPDGLVDATVKQILSMQRDDGSWQMTIIERGPEPGLFLSDLDGTATVSGTLALRAWLDAK
jgi:hypothetical protein